MGSAWCATFSPLYQQLPHPPRIRLRWLAPHNGRQATLNNHLNAVEPVYGFNDDEKEEIQI